ncbi:MAG TPA: ATP-binding protein, partial [Gaiellaceae bacterium]|nr:ATP-binding protein [Gaiellaceae bacterium]
LDVEAQLSDVRFSGEVETALYRMVQEALTNIVKHAQARHVSIVLTAGQDLISALIEDDGRGFDVEAAREGMGLDGMRERLGLIGGKLTIESRPGGGTTLIAKVPLV